MLKIKRISEVLGKRVYTDAGDFLGEVEEVNLSENKVDGWRIRISGRTSSFMGGARGVIVPHNFVKAIGDVFVVSKSSLPIRDDEDISESSVETVE